jgi:iron(III) transport system permease protein
MTAKTGFAVRRLLQDPLTTITLVVLSIFVFITILLPILTMTGESVSAKGLPLFSKYLAEPAYQNIITNTVVMGLLVATVGTAIGFLFAYVQVKIQVPFKRFFHFIALIPIISPPFSLATAIIVLFGRSGMISRGVFGVRYDIYGLDGLTLVLSLSLFTIAYLNIRGMMQALDPSLDEAAMNLGAGKWRIFRTIEIPMLMPGIAGSFLLLFVEAIADLGNPLVLGGNYEVLAGRVYVSITGMFDTTAGAVFSVILLVPALTVFIIQRYWISRASVVSVTGKPTGTPHLITHPLIRWPLFALALFISLLILIIYLTIFYSAFTRITGIDNSFTIDHFVGVISGYGSEAMKDTTVLSMLATPIAGVVGMIMAFLIARKQFPGRGLLDFSTMLGIAVPGTVLGIGYLLVFNNPIILRFPGDGAPALTLIPKLTGARGIFGGALAIVLLYVVRSVPAALRSGVAMLSQIDPAIEEASSSLGAGSARTFRKITLPLIRPAFLSGLIYAFARSMTTISSIIFLTTPETRIMTQQILNEVESGRYGRASAYCVILILIVLVAIAGLYFTVGSKSGAERGLEGGA